MTRAHVALGSNLGDRLATLDAAVQALDVDPHTTVVAVSRVYETAPVGGPEQGPYLNAVAVLETTRSPRGLLELLQATELLLGRRRDVRWGPRTADLDLILYGGLVVDEPDLVVPHPRARGRAFVLVPLVDVDPDATFPDGEHALAALARLGPIRGIAEVGELTAPAAPDFSPAAVVGAGRVGRALAVALRRLGVAVTLGVRVESLAQPVVPELAGVGVAAAIPAAAGARCVLLTVRDDELPGLVAALAAAGSFHAGQIVLHTAGVEGVGVLAPAAAAGAIAAACHPAQTFTDDLAATLARLPGTVWGVTGEEEGAAAARSLVLGLGGTPLDVPEAARARYHAAIVLAANGSAAVTATAADLLRRAGVTDPALVLGKLVHASVDSALASGQAGLSGPWVRGDGRTVALHAAALDERGTIRAAYAALAKLVADRARAAGRLDAGARRRLNAALGTPPRRRSER